VVFPEIMLFSCLFFIQLLIMMRFKNVLNELKTHQKINLVGFTTQEKVNKRSRLESSKNISKRLFVLCNVPGTFPEHSGMFRNVYLLFETFTEGSL
jgi:hypothetical protein